MHARVARFLLPVMLLPAACGPFPSSEAPPVSQPPHCPVTAKPSPPFVPPSPYPESPPARYEREFWYGRRELWTMLSEDGIWSGLPRSDAGYGQKVFWWAEGYSVSREQRPELVVTGRRLDREAGPMTASQATNATADFGEAMLVGVAVPTEGCWEITGRYRDEELSFVVLVEP